MSNRNSLYPSERCQDGLSHTLAAGTKNYLSNSDDARNFYLLRKGTQNLLLNEYLQLFPGANRPGL